MASFLRHMPVGKMDPVMSNTHAHESNRVKLNNIEARGLLKIWKLTNINLTRTKRKRKRGHIIYTLYIKEKFEILHAALSWYSFNMCSGASLLPHLPAWTGWIGFLGVLLPHNDAENNTYDF